MKKCHTYSLITTLLITVFLGSRINSQDLNRRDPFIIDLPSPSYSSQTSIEEAIKSRSSIRSYSDSAITLDNISQILWAAYGITRPNKLYKTLRGGNRTVPSAGALYPLEFYICSGNISGLDDGIYWYRSDGHKLIRIIAGDLRNEISSATFGQKYFKNAAAIIILTADFSRTESKYGNRGITRYVYLEAGHSAQNIYLQATSLNIGVCVVGAFNDKKISELIKMKNENPLYITPIGKPKESRGK